MSWTRKVFISHRWGKDEYDTIKKWLDRPNYYHFADYSISVDKKIEGLSDSKLKEAIAEQIIQCSVFIVPAAMYVAYSDWIQFEIDTALEYEKPILAVIPNGQQKTPNYVTNNATLIVGWRATSIIDGITQLTQR